ncbi:unnamed protein product, partial [Heligmosomoides polygyrus]|uniref:C-CAP/cofactor C-like domain-containing protein n=1 Tax=Heligmosomoides polygyrus TaxID=6339 RepID=A0A183FZT7_HELPZ
TDCVQVLSKVVFPHKGDEVHHTGWNACSSCYDKPAAKRSHLVIPCLNSDRIYIVNVTNERSIKLEKVGRCSALFSFSSNVGSTTLFIYPPTTAPTTAPATAPVIAPATGLLGRTGGGGGRGRGGGGGGGGGRPEGP